MCPLEVQDGVSRRVWVIPLMGEGEQDRSGGGVGVGGRPGDCPDGRGGAEEVAIRVFRWLKKKGGTGRGFAEEGVG